MNAYFRMGLLGNFNFKKLSEKGDFFEVRGLIDFW